jgi:hypothetical protein
VVVDHNQSFEEDNLGEGNLEEDNLEEDIVEVGTRFRLDILDTVLYYFDLPYLLLFVKKKGLLLYICVFYVYYYIYTLIKRRTSKLYQV